MDEERSKSERMEEERAVAQAVCEVGNAISREVPILS
jgi:hypothetical protein